MKKSIIYFILCFTSFSVCGDDLKDLLAYERNTIEVFQQASPKVVYVHRMTAVSSPHPQQLLVVPNGSGSGIIWDHLGHIVTNYHVIKDADAFSVTLGKITVAAKIIGAEPRKDLAVLKIEDPKALALLKTFTPFKMAPTHSLMVGQKTIAIGNPFGFDHSLTVGVISALGRQIPGVGGTSIRDMIQTDASINPGNSGGPLLDSLGRLIGLNTLIYSQSGTSSGVGFAVPADEIVRTVTQIIQHGRVMLAGIGITPVDPRLAAHLGVRRGILIYDILPNTPAEKIGLLRTYRSGMGQIILGDVIIGLNGHPVNNYDELYNLLTQIHVGDEVTLTLLRQGKSTDLRIKTIDIGAF
jgi:S1-C subfamily serine protease